MATQLNRNWSLLLIFIINSYWWSWYLFFFLSKNSWSLQECEWISSWLTTEWHSIYDYSSVSWVTISLCLCLFYSKIKYTNEKNENAERRRKESQKIERVMVAKHERIGYLFAVCKNKAAKTFSDERHISTE